MRGEVNIQRYPDVLILIEGEEVEIVVQQLRVLTMSEMVTPKMLL